MNKDKIVTFLESFIKRNLNFSYQPQLPVQLFCDTKIAIENLKISGNTPVFQLVGDELCKGQWNCLKYRFPGTRIYLHEFQNLDFKIQIIEYFDDNIIYLKNFTDRKQCKLTLRFQPGLQITGSEPLSRQTDETLLFQFDMDAVFWLSGNEKKRQINKIPAFLTDTANSEKEIHPFKFTSALDAQLMRDIDQRWAEQNYIGPQREIDVQKILETDPADLIWIQEIYLHFGWYRDLTHVYTYLNANRASLTEINTRKILNTAYRRYREVIKLFDYDNTNVQFDFDDAKTDEPDVSDFLNGYLNNGEVGLRNQSDNLWKESIYTQLPLFSLAAMRDVLRNPDLFMALILSLFHNDFYRTPAIADKLLNNFPKTKRNLIKFLIAVKTIANISFDRKKIKLGKFLISSNLDRLNSSENQLKVKYIRHGDRTFTELENNNELRLKIDKTVNINFEPNKKRLGIKPVIYCPPIKKPNFYAITIDTGGYELSLPLIWKNFTLEMNGVRLKFLLKNKRFQISGKFDKDANGVRIEQSQLSPAEGRYFKTYHTPEFFPTRPHIDIFDQYGRPIDIGGPFIKRIFPRGTAVNGRGLLIEQFRVFRGTSKKSTGIATNRQNPAPLMISDQEFDLKLTAEKMDSINLKREQSEGLFHRLINTDAVQLIHKLIIFTDNYTVERCEKIKRLCYDSFAFMPTIKPLELIEWKQPDFIIVVAEKSEFEVVRDFDIFSIIRGGGRGKNKGIWVREEKLQSFFSRECFIF